MVSKFLAGIGIAALLYTSCAPFISPPRIQQQLVQMEEIKVEELDGKIAHELIAKNLENYAFAYDFLQGAYPYDTLSLVFRDNAMLQFYDSIDEYLRRNGDRAPISIGLTETSSDASVQLFRDSSMFIFLARWYFPASRQSVIANFCVTSDNEKEYAYRKLADDFAYGKAADISLIELIIKDGLTSCNEPQTIK